MTEKIQTATPEKQETAENNEVVEMTPAEIYGKFAKGKEKLLEFPKLPPTDAYRTLVAIKAFENQFEHLGLKEDTLKDIQSKKENLIDNAKIELDKANEVLHKYNKAIIAAVFAYFDEKVSDNKLEATALKVKNYLSATHGQIDPETIFWLVKEFCLQETEIVD